MNLEGVCVVGKQQIQHTQIAKRVRASFGMRKLIFRSVSTCDRLFSWPIRLRLTFKGHREKVSFRLFALGSLAEPGLLYSIPIRSIESFYGCELATHAAKASSIHFPTHSLYYLTAAVSKKAQRCPWFISSVVLIGIITIIIFHYEQTNWNCEMVFESKRLWIHHRGSKGRRGEGRGYLRPSDQYCRS
jgi:hypothetical protein